jgi:NitT/TauT family transport system substrate-binding protein
MKKIIYILFSALTVLTLSIIVACTKKQPEKIDFLLDWKAGPEYIGYIIAKEKGFYKEENLDVTLIEGTGASDAAKVIGAGKYNIGVSSAAATVIGKTQGMPIISVAVLFQKSPVVIYSLKEKNITKPQDLIGKKLGVLYGSSTYIEYKAMMAKQGIDRSKVKEVGVGWEVQPLITGEIDALMGYTQNQPNLVRLAGKEVNQIFVEDWGVNIYSSCIIVNENYLKENEDIVKRIVKASLKGWEYSLEHPDEAINIVLKAYPALDEKFVKASTRDTLPLLKSPDTQKYGLGYQSPERWKNLQDLLFEQGIIKKKVDVSLLFTNKYLPKR